MWAGWVGGFLLPFPEDAISFTNLWLVAPPALAQFFGWSLGVHVLVFCSDSWWTGENHVSAFDEKWENVTLQLCPARDSSGASGLPVPVQEVATRPWGYVTKSIECNINHYRQDGLVTYLSDFLFSKKTLLYQHMRIIILPTLCFCNDQYCTQCTQYLEHTRAMSRFMDVVYCNINHYKSMGRGVFWHENRIPHPNRSCRRSRRCATLVIRAKWSFHVKHASNDIFRRMKMQRVLLENTQCPL